MVDIGTILPAYGKLRFKHKAIQVIFLRKALFVNAVISSLTRIWSYTNEHVNVICVYELHGTPLSKANVDSEALA